SFRGARKKSKAQAVATSRFLERSTGRIDESGGQLFTERSTSLTAKARVSCAAKGGYNAGHKDFKVTFKVR
ncbi:MAG: hypothetical protein IJ087_21545, partial [Eggerthellaceae bacterium]|nr:hypothetical protein [Eggerthellaceae bacterium]